jgi:glycine/D-amino acid oxidase-like deaminating enzyme
MSAHVAYDPLYDPLKDPTPGRGREYAPTYWIASAGAPPDDDGPVRSDIEVEVAIIGSGYTGLSAALHLARDHGIGSVVLEANRVAFGCSTRNGGQGQFATGRLKRSGWIDRWGVDVAKGMHAECMEAFELFRSLLAEPLVGADAVDGGHIYAAHRPWAFEKLKKESALLNEVFGYPSRVLSAAETREQHFNDRECCGAQFEPDGVAVHPAKYAFGLLRLARSLGVRVHPSSPVEGWSREGDRYILQTPGGRVRARRVIVATAGYTAPGLHRLVTHRLLPVLSNSIVTRRLTQAEIEDCGFRSDAFYTDTRILRHYYRFIRNDARVQIGSRSAITGRDADNPKHLDRLRRALGRKFPSLDGIELDYSWWGWVDVGHDMMPRIVRPDPNEHIFYSLAYGGNGVMYSAQAGRRVAALAAGKPVPALPIFASALPSEGILTPFRRLGQRLLYIWYFRNDERP